jgi:hypothetical protein
MIRSLIATLAVPLMVASARQPRPCRAVHARPNLGPRANGSRLEPLPKLIPWIRLCTGHLQTRRGEGKMALERTIELHPLMECKLKFDISFSNHFTVLSRKASPKLMQPCGSRS